MACIILAVQAGIHAVMAVMTATVAATIDMEAAMTVGAATISMVVAVVTIATVAISSMVETSVL